MDLSGKSPMDFGRHGRSKKPESQYVFAQGLFDKSSVFQA